MQPARQLPGVESPAQPPRPQTTAPPTDRTMSGRPAATRQRHGHRADQHDQGDPAPPMHHAATASTVRLVRQCVTACRRVHTSALTSHHTATNTTAAAATASATLRPAWPILASTHTTTAEHAATDDQHAERMCAHHRSPPTTTVIGRRREDQRQRTQASVTDDRVGREGAEPLAARALLPVSRFVLAAGLGACAGPATVCVCSLLFTPEWTAQKRMSLEPDRRFCALFLAWQ